jgi:hypothetical protein
MADACSRMWHFSDSHLLAYFGLHFPQTRRFQLLPLRKRMHSALTLALLISGSRQELQAGVPAPWTSIDHAGMNSDWSIVLTQTPNSDRTPLLSSKYLDNDTAMDAWPTARGPCDLVQWRTQSAPLVRCMSDWGSLIRGKTYTVV